MTEFDLEAAQAMAEEFREHNISLPVQKMFCHLVDYIAELESRKVTDDDILFLLSFAPKDCPKGLDATLSYEGDKVLQERIDRIRAALQEAEK